jgi:hypothetical protein
MIFLQNMVHYKLKALLINIFLGLFTTIVLSYCLKKNKNLLLVTLLLLTAALLWPALSSYTVIKCKDNFFKGTVYCLTTANMG